MFDVAHVLIFLIVVLFVSMIALILWRFAYFCQQWDDYEVTAMECVKQGTLPHLPHETNTHMRTQIPSERMESTHTHTHAQPGQQQQQRAGQKAVCPNG